MNDDRPGTADALQRVSDWIVEQGLVAERLDDLLDGFCRRLVDELGLPVWRMHLSMATVHPTLAAIGGTWFRETGVRSLEFGHQSTEEPDWMLSPLRLMVLDDIPVMRRRLDRPGFRGDFPVFDELKAAGGTDWYGRLLHFGGAHQPAGLPGIILTWTCDRPGGFSDGEIAMLDRLAQRVALAGYRMTLQQLAVTLLDAYVGSDAGQRILAGQVERGAARRITAVVFMADLRGFTPLSDVIPGEALLAWLNGVLGRVVDAVEGEGGEVLKFLGDGLLAIFPPVDGDVAGACRRSLAAAQSALAAHAAAQAAEPDQPQAALDIALDLGELLYGNVGAAHRLDFTVIGPAVNQVSRIETLCAVLGEPLLVSEPFAAAHDGPLRPLGPQRLRGLDRPRPVFAP